MAGKRHLIVTADDFGIGPATSQGILELGMQGRISASVLLVNSPHAETAVHSWRQANQPLELGWHPCLTLDQPVLPAGKVPSLVNDEGRFFPLGQFLRRLVLGRIRATDIEAELKAQYQRCCDLLGAPPRVINSHHHVQVFPPIGAVLCEVLRCREPLPYVRRVCEPWRMLAQVSGARLKRFVLSTLGGRNARDQAQQGFPGNAWLAGITDPPCVADPDFFARWLQRIPGPAVELTCHPGYLDPTLIGRDCTATDGQLQRRVRELHLLRQASFEDACRQAGFTLASPAELRKLQGQGRAEAA